jgi:hypothetical protein
MITSDRTAKGLYEPTRSSEIVHSASEPTFSSRSDGIALWCAVCRHGARVGQAARQRLRVSVALGLHCMSTPVVVSPNAPPGLQKAPGCTPATGALVFGGAGGAGFGGTGLTGALVVVFTVTGGTITAGGAAVVGAGAGVAVAVGDGVGDGVAV